MRRIKFAVLALAAALFTCLLTTSTATAQAPVVIDSVDASGPAFSPPNVTVDTGQVVRWEFDAAQTPHTVTSSSSNWTIDEERNPGGAAIERSFDAPGLYTFLCRFHGGMNGSVTVEDPAADPLERVLVFSKTQTEPVVTFRHDSIPAGIAAIQEIGAANDFAVDTTEDAAQFNDANLAQYDAVIWLSTTGDILNGAQQLAFRRYIQAGGGYVGIHAASDTEYTWPWYGEMLGGYFKSHPPGTPEASVDITDADEPSTQGLPVRWTRTDEWYNFQSFVDPVVGGGAAAPDYSPRDSDVHVLATLDESTLVEDDGNATDDDHPISWCSDFDGGRVWYTGMGHTIASFAEPEFRQHLLGGIETASGAEPADCGEPREASLSAEDFEIVTVDDDTESPMELDVAEDGRVFYVERITGELNVWNPVSGQVTTALDLNVDSALENGLMGLQLDPDFATNGHVYVTWSPLPRATAPMRISRFTVVDNNIDPLSEQIIFTWQAQRELCCHTSGSLAFDEAGNLYLATGDNTNPHESGGFAPTDERSGRQFFDAQRTSANTNDPNGKILRIRPIPGATGAHGPGLTYTIPDGNMFAAGTANTLPEIYAMGFRNPFRITIDPHTGWVLLGDYGPDAPQTNPNRGPQGSVEYNVVKEPGFYGWPYCVRDNVPYRDYNFETSASGPAYSCASPVNNSPNNTGLTNLPPAVPATMWMGYSETDDRFPGLGGGGAPTGGPRYEFDPDNENEAKFPAFYDRHWFIGEWNNGWIKTATLDDEGNGTGVFNTPWMDTFSRPHEMEFGPDGSLYVIDWGDGFGGNNADSGIYRIDYVAGGRRPIARATSNRDNGPAPLEVTFSSTGSVDPDGGSLTYAWDFDGDGDTDSTEASPTHSYPAGTYDATLTVTDQDGQQGFDTIRITSGNTRPTVTITVPDDGQFHAFGDLIPYEITVTDPENTVDCDDVVLSLQLGHDEHAHGMGQQTGCSGNVRTATDGGHGSNANIFTSLVASYTDEAQGPAGALTGLHDIVLQPKPKQAEYFDDTGRTGSNTGGTPGVQTEITSDAGGGTNIGWTENGDWVSFERTNLEELTGLRFRVASGGAGGTVQVRLDAPDGELVGEAVVANTGGWQSWVDVDIPLASPPEGTHELFLVFVNPTAAGGDGLINMNHFTALGKGAAISASPDVTASADPASGAAPLAVQFTGTVTDPDGEPGDELTYLWNFGVAGTDEDTSTEQNPTYTYANPGTYTARLTATDESGQSATGTVQVEVTSGGECPENNLRSDEFGGDALDEDRWQVIRPDATRPPTVSDGHLNFPIDNGSIFGPGTSARNIIVQPLPSGDVEVTAKITTDPLTQNYQQAGLRVYSDDNNWASVHMIHAGGQRDIEFIWESNGTARNEPADKLGGIPATDPLTYWVRLVSDGEQLTAFYSYDGEDFLPVGRAGSLATFENPQVGPVALSDQAPEYPVARFDWIRFNPDETTGGGGGGGGGGGEVLFDDAFDGTELGAGWQVVRPDQLLDVSGGALRIPAQPGDLYQDRNDAPNIVLREPPDGEWEATAKLNFEGTTQYHQAGIIAYGDDQNFTKFGRIAHTAAGAEKFEFIYENNGVARNEPPPVDSTADLAADFPDDFWVRIASDGTNVSGEYSTNGEDWVSVGRPAPLPANARIGMFAFSNDGTGNPEAAFDSFTITTPGAPSGPSRDDQFNGSALDTDRWNAIVRGDASTRAVSGGNLTITTELGDIYGTPNSDPPPKNFILQSADHAGADWVIETKLSGTIDDSYAQGGLIAYLDDGNYVKFDAISDVDQPAAGINPIELRSEVAGSVTNPQPEVTGVPATATDIWLRLTKAGSTYTGEYSYDGQTWTAMSAPVTNAMAAPQFGLFAFSPQAPAVGDTVSFDYFTLDGADAGEPCEECETELGPGDEFDGTSLDTAKWDAIAHDDPTRYAVSGGDLTVTTTAGEIYQASTGGGPLILQSGDDLGADWELETSFTHTLDGGYSQGGIMAYGGDDDYVKINAISDAGSTTPNRLELRSETGGTVPNPGTDPTVPAGTTEIGLRLTKAGNTYSGAYSFDGGATWTPFPYTVTNAMAAPDVGPYTQGVQQAGDTVSFEYFAIDGNRGECLEPEPENRAPQVESVTASPTIGFGPLEVDFAITATDPDEGDELTYSWDFGDGSAPSTTEDPTHTYTAPGEYEAEVTVSDGDADVVRRVAVQVLEPDDAGARLRTLVFSRTTGFRHSAIDESHAALELMGDQENFQVDHTEDPTAFTAAILDHYDTVVFSSTTGDVLDAGQQAAFEAYIRGGGGYVGIHSASDTEYDWNWYGHLVGGYFLSHPENQTATVRVEDQEHPSTAGLPASYSKLDEWYNFRSPDYADPNVPDGDYSPRDGGVRVLATVDETTYNEADGNETDDDHPVTWCQAYDGGRSWYTAMGHVEASYTEANFLQQVLGGLETTAGLEPAGECSAGDPDAPTVQAFANPRNGDAPLRVQFSATGLDPQGGRLTYRWDFGDGGSSLTQSPVHVYREPGTFTATVTARDPQGKTATAEIEIVVTERGNEVPTVDAAADPTSGDAPLLVRFSAQGFDPDGPESGLTYLWDFDDGGSNAFGRTARHTYMEPGTYTATVTVTDAAGSSATAEVEITVENPPGNVPPTVQAAADPRSGTAPLVVRFTSAATDPDGDQVSSVWDFGDGVQAGGRNATHTYTAAGTYDATVTVTDPGGATDTATVRIVVAAALAGTSEPPAAPAPIAPTGTGGVAGETETAPLVAVPKARKVRGVVKRGLRYRVSCEDACRVSSVLRLSGRRLGATKAVRIAAGGSRTMVLRLDRNVRRNLLAAMRKSKVRRLQATVVTRIVTADGTRTVRAKVTLKL